jgi:uncharacterized surface protein with fasciclin (FAS1) repeats
MNSDDDNTQDKDIVVNAANAGNFTMFLNALKAADMTGTFKGMGPFTLFAPTDAAFGKLPRAQLNELLKDRARLAQTINLHVIHGTALHDLEASDTQSVQGQTLSLKGGNGTFTVNGAKVDRKHIEACNGVIHGIDAVISLKH